MKKIMCLFLLVATPALAQKLELGPKIPTSGVSTDGQWKQTGRIFKVQDGKCYLNFKYQSVNDPSQVGKTESTWTATSQDGGHLCTNGRWRDLSGSGNSGSNSNIFIKSSSAFRVM